MATIYTKIVNRKLSISEKLPLKVSQFFTTFSYISQLCLKIGLSSQRPKCWANLSQIMTSSTPGPYLDIGGPQGHFCWFFHKSPSKSPVFIGSFAVTFQNPLQVVCRLLISTSRVPLDQIQMLWPKSHHRGAIFRSYGIPWSNQRLYFYHKKVVSQCLT